MCPSGVDGSDVRPDSFGVAALEGESIDKVLAPRLNSFPSGIA
jgi:hypothetical protein